ncbi:putative pentatricopeptide repeat-containing protein [Tanacetum coccineum]
MLASQLSYHLIKVLATSFETRSRFPELVIQEEKRVRFVVINGLDIIEKPTVAHIDDAECGSVGLMAEVTIVFVDTWVTCTDSLCWFHDQFDAVEIYCDRKLKAHPDNRVGIVSYGHEEALLLGATNNLRGVSLALGDLKVRKAKYTTNLLRGFEYSRDGWEQDMKRRMVVFTGGPLYFPRDQLPQAIQFLKEERVVLDVVDFGTRLNDDADEYKTKQILLKELVNAMNDDNNNSNENEDSRYFLIEDCGFSLSHHISTSSILPSLSEEQARIKRIRHCRLAHSGSSPICSNHNTVGEKVVDYDWLGGEVFDYCSFREVVNDSGWLDGWD